MSIEALLPLLLPSARRVVDERSALCSAHAFSAARTAGRAPSGPSAGVPRSNPLLADRHEPQPGLVGVRRGVLSSPMALPADGAI